MTETERPKRVRFSTAELVIGGDDFRHLDGDRIVETIDRLLARIHERFPGSGLHRVCTELRDVAARSKARSAEIGRPMLLIRGAALAFVVIVLVVGIATAPRLPIMGGRMEVAEFVQMVDAGLGAAVVIGASVFFLVTLEIRIRRRKALAALHELRSIAHVIDMHQLTKDPERVRPGTLFTDSSPRSDMTRFELERYLDYCTEMLSLTGKVAALYVQQFDDAVAIASASEVEALCTGLSRKIWQKINISQGLGLEDAEEENPDPEPPPG